MWTSAAHDSNYLSCRSKSLVVSTIYLFPDWVDVTSAMAVGQGRFGLDYFHLVGKKIIVKTA